MKGFEILIASPPDKEKLVAEIWYENKMIAEINQETGKSEIEIYPGKELKFSFEDFVNALEMARVKLII